MDGVITNSMPDHYHAWRTILHKENIQVTHLDIYSREGQPGISTIKELAQFYKKCFDVRKLKQILRDKENLFKKIVKQRFILGARSFLKELRKNKFMLGLVTGTSRHELHQILPDYLYNLFTVTITGNDVYYGKPHPEPYLKALKKLKIHPKEAVVIENAPFGIQSAKGAGLRCLAIETSLPKGYLKESDYIFESIEDLRNRVNFIPFT